LKPQFNRSCHRENRGRQYQQINQKYPGGSGAYAANPSQHNEIILHLQNRDKDGAQAAMRRHVEEARARIVNRF